MGEDLSKGRNIFAPFCAQTTNSAPQNNAAYNCDEIRSSL